MMRLLTISNLFPTPVEPLRGLFNLRLFRSLSRLAEVRNICPVFGWARGARGWRCPVPDAPETIYVPVPYAPFLSRPFNWRLLMMAAGKAVMETGADAVYAAWLYPDGVAAARMARRSGKPCWLMALGSDVGHLSSRRRGTLVVESCNAAAGVICVASHLKDELVEAGVRPDKVHVVPNGVDASLFHPRPRAGAVGRLKLSGAWPAGLSEEAGVVMFVGNLVEVKRPLLLLESWAGYMRRHKERQAECALLVIGDGPLASSMQREIRRSGLERSVLLLGARPSEEVALWMNVADCLCLCSSSEGMPNVVLEALASGLPVVSTAAGAAPEILKDCKNAAVVPETRSNGDLAERLASSIELCLARSARDRLAERTMLWKRSWDDMARDIIALISRGNGRRRGRT